MEANFEDLRGLVLSAVTLSASNDTLLFEAVGGRRFKLFHERDCCESVSIESIVGDLTDLVGHPILHAEIVSSDDEPAPSEGYDSYTWTFYKVGTIQGGVTIRWLGESNGYYSEGVSFIELGEDGTRLN